ncbi:MAG: hypothetical protein QG670_291 [Thermoproteota archaeon]|nr:hypothetical protein [Thermoproteota archaeon]
MVKVGITKAGGIYDAIMGWKQKPLEGVILEEAFQLFGQWDFGILFQADTNENALHFVGDIARQIDGVVETSTIPIVTVRDYRRS